MAGLEYLWILGDRFCFDTVNTHLITMSDEESYIKRNFDVHNFSSCMFASNDTNILSRILNELNRGFVELKLLPKLILVVLEDDLIQVLSNKHTKAKCTAPPKYGREIKWLMREFVKAISIFKEFLPDRAKKDKYPHICWLMPVTNVNFSNNKDRERFGQKLKECASLFPNMSALKLVQVWDIYDRNLYLQLQRRFTHEGKITFWRAADKTVRFCDTNILKKPVVEQQQFKFKKNWNGRGKSTSWNKYRKPSSTVSTVQAEQKNRYVLPPPPPTFQPIDYAEDTDQEDSD